VLPPAYASRLRTQNCDRRSPRCYSWGHNARSVRADHRHPNVADAALDARAHQRSLVQTRPRIPAGLLAEPAQLVVAGTAAGTGPALTSDLELVGRAHSDRVAHGRVGHRATVAHPHAQATPLSVRGR